MPKPHALDRIDAIVAPGTSVNPVANSFDNPGLAPSARHLHAKPIGESDGSKINGHDKDGQPDRFDIPKAAEPWPELEAARRSGDWSDFKHIYNV